MCKVWDAGDLFLRFTTNDQSDKAFCCREICDKRSYLSMPWGWYTCTELKKKKKNKKKKNRHESNPSEIIKWSEAFCCLQTFAGRGYKPFFQG